MARDETTSMDIERYLSRVAKASAVARVAVLAFAAAFVVVDVLLVVGSARDVLGGASAGSLESLSAAVECLLYAVVLVVISLVLGDVAKGRTPFTARQVSRLRFLALVLLAFVVFDAVRSAGVLASAEWGDIYAGVSNDVRTFIHINMFALFMAVLCGCLSFVFKYGILLQEVSDDTV